MVLSLGGNTQSYTILSPMGDHPRWLISHSITCWLVVQEYIAYKIYIMFSTLTLLHNGCHVGL